MNVPQFVSCWRCHKTGLERTRHLHENDITCSKCGAYSVRSAARSRARGDDVPATLWEVSKTETPEEANDPITPTKGKSLMTTGERIKNAIEETGMSLTEAALKFNYTRSAMYHLITRRKRFNALRPKTKLLLDGLGIDVRDVWASRVDGKKRSKKSSRSSRPSRSSMKNRRDAMARARAYRWKTHKEKVVPSRFTLLDLTTGSVVTSFNDRRIGQERRANG